MENTATPRSLDDLHNRHTRYEVAIKIDGVSFVAGYMLAKSRSALIAVARDHSEQLLKALGNGPDQPWSYSMKNGLQFAPNVRVYYTGRTERDARLTLDKDAAK